MKGPPAFLAFDIGAESGRVVLGRLQNDRIELQEIHRFPNGPVQIGDSLHWDVLHLWQEMKHGLAHAVREAGDSLVSLGVDTWGVDFGLLDVDDNLIGNPFHYRDRRTGGGAIQDALTHSVNWVESILGPADSVLCDCAHLVLPNVEVEDTVHVSARHGAALVLVRLIGAAHSVTTGGSCPRFMSGARIIPPPAKNATRSPPIASWPRSPSSKCRGSRWCEAGHANSQMV